MYHEECPDIMSCVFGYEHLMVCMLSENVLLCMCVWDYPEGLVDRLFSVRHGNWPRIRGFPLEKKMSAPKNKTVRSN